MGRVRVDAFSISLDGFAAGDGQSLDDPLGCGGPALHQWMFDSGVSLPAAPEMGDIDAQMAERALEGIGAWIMGRNMFGPVRGPWPDDQWQGWWGPNPPYHCPVYVLTHHARAPIEMEGGTVFHFVTGGIEEAMGLARRSARGRDIRIGGGAATVRQYLEARMIDDIHLAISPCLLGRGESLFAGLDFNALGYEVVRYQPGKAACHMQIGRRG